MFARLSSLAMAATLSKAMACRMKSTHAVIGSFGLSKMVPVTGVLALPQAAQRYLCTPDLFNPAFATAPPQRGQTESG